MNEYYPMPPYAPINAPQSSHPESEMNEYFPMAPFQPIFAGVDLASQMEQRARALGQDPTSPLMPFLSPSDAAKAKKYAQAFGKFLGKAVPSTPSSSWHFPDINLPNITLPNIDASSMFGQTPEKMSAAADAAQRAADAATAAAKEHEETMRVVKYAVIGVGALGGLALLWSIVR